MLMLVSWQHLTPTDPIVFNYPVLNPGGHYDNTTGVYTVPIDGDYEFIFYLLSNEDQTIGGHLNVDGVRVSSSIIKSL